MREFLKGLELDKETIDTIMAEHGKIITADKEEVTKLKEDISAKNDLIKTANAEIESYKGMNIEEIKASGEKYKADFENAEATYKQELAKRDLRDAIKDKLIDAGIEFSSEYAKKGVLEDLLSNENIVLDEKGLNGFDDVMKSIQETQPKAFIVKDGKGEERNSQTPPPPMYAGAGKDPITPTEADTMKKQYSDAQANKNTTEMARLVRVASEKGVDLD